MNLPDQFDNYKRPDIQFEKPYGKNPVEPGASLPVKVQVEQMLTAGKRLAEWRASQFDFDEGMEVPDDVSPDPTRDPNFDLADASQAQELAAQNLLRTAREYAASKAKSGTDKVPATEPASKSEVN